MRKLVLLMTLLALTGKVFLAHAASWVEISKDSDISVLVDTESIRKHGDYPQLIKYWTKQISNRPRDIRGKTYFSAVYLFVADCKDSTQALAQAAYYAGDGTVVDSNTRHQGQWLFADVIPGSVGESALNFACNIVQK